MPAPGTLMQGFSGQTAGGFRMPLTVRVTKGGRAYALWNAVLKCGRVSWPMLDLTPSPEDRAPTARSAEARPYTIRYKAASASATA